MILALLLARTAGSAPPPRNLQTILDQMRQEQTACQLEGADYVMFTDDPKSVYVLVPQAIYHRRKEAEVAPKLACTIKIATDRGLRPILLGRDS